MKPISIEKFANSVVKTNKDINKNNLIQSLKDAVKAKQEGATCLTCSNLIWAASSAITGTYMCFACTTGEADDSEDYEIDSVCFLG